MPSSVDKQDLGLPPRRERDRTLGRDTGAVTCGKDDLAEGHLSLHEMKPCLSPLRQLVDHVPPCTLDEAHMYMPPLIRSTCPVM